jgi:Rod binding domain-containing protein
MKVVPAAVADPKQIEPKDAKADYDTRHAAQQFEAMLLKQMLSSLEKATRVGGERGSAGSSQYGSMIVEALSDAVAQAGGIGVGEMMVQNVSQRVAEKKVSE